MSKRALGSVVGLMAIGTLACGGGAKLTPVQTGTGGGAAGVAGHLGAAGAAGAAAGVDGGAAGVGGATAGVGGATVGAGGATAGIDGGTAGADGAVDEAVGEAGPSVCVPALLDGSAAGSEDASTAMDAPSPDAGGGSPTLTNGNCVTGAFKHGAVCECQADTPTVCDLMCTDVTLDPANCGACNHACAATATCNGGRCGPSVMNVVPAAPGCVALHIAVGPGALYWTDQGHGTVKSSVACVGTTISSTETNPGLVTVAGSTLFWINSSMSGGQLVSTTATIRAASLPNGAPRDVVTEINTTGGILGLVVSSDGNTVFYSAGTKVREIPAAGGTPVDVAREELGGIPTGLALAGNTIAFVTQLNGDVDVVTINNADGLIASCGTRDPTDPNMERLLNVHCTRVARSQGAPFFGGLILARGNLYWSNDGSIVLNSAAQVTTMDGYDADNMQVATTGGDAVTALAGNANNIYFGSDGTIEKTPYDASSNAVQIARGQMMPGSMALDATRVYWSTGDCAINATGL